MLALIRGLRHFGHSPLEFDLLFESKTNIVLYSPNKNVAPEMIDFKSIQGKVVQFKHQAEAREFALAGINNFTIQCPISMPGF